MNEYGIIYFSLNLFKDEYCICGSGKFEITNETTEEDIINIIKSRMKLPNMDYDYGGYKPNGTWISGNSEHWFDVEYPFREHKGISMEKYCKLFS